MNQCRVVGIFMGNRGFGAIKKANISVRLLPILKEIIILEQLF